MAKIVIIMGSKADLEHSKKIAETIQKFKVECIMRIASAHKVPLKVMSILKSYENDTVVFITVAGRSNALSGFVDANTASPVVACPPYSEKYGGADIYSTLRMPSGVCPMTVLEPDQAGLAALKILAINDKNLHSKLRKYQEEKKAEIESADNALLK